MRNVLISVASALLMATSVSAQTTAAATAAPERVTDKPDRIICKTFLETGSLARRHKVCATKHDWDVQRQEYLHQPNTSSACQKGSEGAICK